MRLLECLRSNEKNNNDGPAKNSRLNFIHYCYMHVNIPIITHTFFGGNAHITITYIETNKGIIGTKIAGAVLRSQPCPER
jgi:hypothetical protein